jgi:glutathione synthase/RimK-type ligase-like ATP-grasp enzyme
MRPRIALVTCAELPGADDDTRELLAPLAALGVDPCPVVWSDRAVDWEGFDLAIVRSCWDYASRRNEFLEWAARVPRLANPSAVLAWNTDKHYLRELEAEGIPTVPTIWLAPDDAWDTTDAALGGADWVIKPAVSLASLDTGRYDLRALADRRLAADHVRRLQHTGRHVMVQPYCGAIDTEGETSLVFLAGVFSHAVRKGAMLDGPDRGLDRRFLPGGGARLAPHRPNPAERTLAERVVDAVPGRRRQLLYARVDLVPDADGAPRLMELELTEPQLFFRLVPESAQRFARTVARYLDQYVRETGPFQGPDPASHAANAA